MRSCRFCCCNYFMFCVGHLRSCSSAGLSLPIKCHRSTYAVHWGVSKHLYWKLPVFRRSLSLVFAITIFVGFAVYSARWFSHCEKYEDEIEFVTPNRWRTSLNYFDFRCGIHCFILPSSILNLIIIDCIDELWYWHYTYYTCGQYLIAWRIGDACALKLISVKLKCGIQNCRVDNCCHHKLPNPRRPGTLARGVSLQGQLTEYTHDEHDLCTVTFTKKRCKYVIVYAMVL